MEKVILLRFGELYLKGKNKKVFEKALFSNIKNSLKDIDCKVYKIAGRYVIRDYKAEVAQQIINLVKNTFGIVSLSEATEISTTLPAIESAIKELRLTENNFRVSVKRADKSFPIKSNEFEAQLGEIILNYNPDIKVKLKNPEIEIMVDIRENGKTYILSKYVKCVGGMPYGTAGKGLLLLSGGIDSPVAGYMMAKRGLEINALHFHSFPYTSEQAKQKVIKLGEILTSYTNGYMKLFCVPFTEIQEAIHKNCLSEYMITIMRRIMLKIAERVCDTYKLKSIISGESLGQVASQTLESITVTNNAVQNYPIFRPLIGMDKQEIVEISERIDTYETSILPYEDCCTVFLPKNPIIKPKLEDVEKEESKLNIELLIENALNKIEILKLGVNV